MLWVENVTQFYLMSFTNELQLENLLQAYVF